MCEDGAIERLLEMVRHLEGLPISAWSLLPLARTKRSHAVLTVDICIVMHHSTLVALNLKQLI